ncbi:MAG TPA: hypothetical protein VK993_09500, partial [Chthoniobacterales bacterium]|nr:hypothetical protein [Chthoniobacterales bacterium]
ASLSPRDVHNTLVAAGPSFRRGATVQMPSGNIDIAPTVLHLLAIRSAEKLDGRVLAEALTDGKDDVGSVQTDTLEARRSFGDAQWRQYLKISRVADTFYIDEGNGSFAGPERGQK